MEIIKQLEPGDLEQHAQTVTRYIYESFAMASYMERFTLEDAREKFAQLKEYARQGTAILFGCLEDSRLIGFVWAYAYPFREDENRLYVSILHVESACRNRHIGDRLLKEVEKVGIRRGCRAVYLHAEGHNHGAVRFYDRMGYGPERIQLVKQLEKE